MNDKADWQAQAVCFAAAHDLRHAPAVHALDLVSEVGEVAKEILLATDYGRQPWTNRPDLAGELGDALFSLCLLAAAADVDLAQALADTLAKYERRWQTRGSAGSGEN